MGRPPVVTYASTRGQGGQQACCQPVSRLLWVLVAVCSTGLAASRNYYNTKQGASPVGNALPAQQLRCSTFSASELMIKLSFCRLLLVAGASSCEQQREWGKCSESWMRDGGYCELTCGVCKPGSTSSRGGACSDKPPPGDGGSKPSAGDGPAQGVAGGTNSTDASDPETYSGVKPRPSNDGYLPQQQPAPPSPPADQPPAAGDSDEQVVNKPGDEKLKHQGPKGCYALVRDFPQRECQFIDNSCEQLTYDAPDACFLCNRGAGVIRNGLLCRPLTLMMS